MSSLKVAVRVRPFNAREIDMDALSIVEIEGNKTRLYKPRTQNIRDAGRENHFDFTFDYSYWSFDETDSHFATQEQVYKDLGTDVVDCAFEGYNACVFAYGQTGSGKTFTMMGKRDNPGLIPRICEELFMRIKVGQESGTGYKTQASYLEIYNEQVKDLLGPHNRGHSLKVREHPNIGPYVDNLSQHAVSDFDEILECISRGNVQRTTASTNMNDTSSRSHAIFTITFVQAVFMNDKPSETVSKIHLVDLAGSERADATGATGQRLKEGAHINKSLVTLGKVISLLAEQTSKNDNSKRVLYIPYRDSNLTWLLKDSLGGNSKTIMIAALSPADCNYSETLSTLRYANRAKNIINKPTINEDTNVKLIRELREEINKLKSMLSGDINSMTPSSKMLEDLLKKEAQEKVLTEEWTEKWKEAQSILQEQKSLGLRKSGVGVVLDSEMPHLIGIHNDITTGVTLYSLKEGETLIGTVECEIPQDIVLTGDGIQPQHCSIVLRNGNVTLHPRPHAQCWLNAHLIDQPTSISQGDIILLGRTNIFRFNNPAEAAKLRNDLSRSHLDMSRLQLITTSRENLLSSSFYGDDELSTSVTSTPKRNKQYHPNTLTSRDDPELQDENRKILETIENALKQLNIERVQMYEQYKTKVRKLTDELRRLEKEEMDSSELLLCRERELLARKDMLLWEKNNEKVQVGIKITECTQLSGDLLLQAVESLDSAQLVKDNVKKNNDDVRKLEEQILDKEKVLNAGTNKIAKIDEEIMQLDQELQELSSQSREKTEIKSKKSSLKLNLNKSSSSSDAQNDQEEFSNSDTYETCDTFHTISSASPIQNDLPTTSSSSSNFPDKLPSSSSSTVGNGSDSNSLALPLPPNPLMSDSGVCLESIRVPNGNGNIGNGVPVVVTSPTSSIGGEATKSASDDDTASCSSCETGRSSEFSKSYCSMHALRRKIAAQKALIMKNLEMDADKAQLDMLIAQLQELQRRYVKMEKELTLSGRSHLECCNDEEINFDDGNCSNTMTQSMDNSSYVPSMTMSCPSIREYPHEPDQFISIPSFVIRGAGKQTHYEYEIRIILPDGKLNILRRYSRFRELHLTMKHCYGSKIGALSFPRREIFSSNSESVAKHRRRLLELYVRRLIVVCARIPQSPIYEGPGGPGITRVSLANLSPFFKKGLFENGKHGTG